MKKLLLLLCLLLTQPLWAAEKSDDAVSIQIIETVIPFGLLDRAADLLPFPDANIRVRTDANGYLITSNGVYTGPDGPLTAMANLRMKTDANGYLLTTFGSGGSTSVIPISINGIATVSTDALLIQNTTVATAGVPVQQSPRIRLRSNVWNTTAVAANNTNDFWIESVPVSGTAPLGMMKFGSSLNGGAATFPLTIDSSGDLTTLSTIVSGASVYVANGQSLRFIGGNGTGLYGPIDGQLNITNVGITAGFGLDVNTDAVAKFRTRAQTGYATVDALGLNLAGAPAVVSTAPTVTSGFGSGTPGTIVTGSTAFAFRVAVGTNAGGTAGVIGMPTATNFWNCSAWDQTTPLDITRQTASSSSSLTFTTTVAWTTGDIIVFLCGGS